MINFLHEVSDALGLERPLRINELATVMNDDPEGFKHAFISAQSFANGNTQEGLFKEFYEYLFSEGIRLSEIAGQMVKDHKLTGPALTELQILVSGVGSSSDSFMRSLANGDWYKIGKPLDVTQMWLKKSDGEVTGAPEERKYNPEGNWGYARGVIMESGGKRTPAFAVSNLDYRPIGEGSDEMTAPLYLIPIGEVMWRKYANGRRGVVTQQMMEATSLLFALDELAVSMCRHDDSWDEAHDLYLIPEEPVKREIKPEDNPEAAYKIGEWS
jgi:hypothetical protein